VDERLKLSVRRTRGSRRTSSSNSDWYSVWNAGQKKTIVIRHGATGA
jgi:hypothetical protein